MHVIIHFFSKFIKYIRNIIEEIYHGIAKNTPAEYNFCLETNYWIITLLSKVSEF